MREHNYSQQGVALEWDLLTMREWDFLTKRNKPFGFFLFTAATIPFSCSDFIIHRCGFFSYRGTRTQWRRIVNKQTVVGWTYKGVIPRFYGNSERKLSSIVKKWGKNRRACFLVEFYHEHIWPNALHLKGRWYKASNCFRNRGWKLPDCTQDELLRRSQLIARIEPVKGNFGRKRDASASMQCTKACQYSMTSWVNLHL